ncbi:MAG TPA: hypothetical protein VIU61_23550 [Kofleriaceae bacterium]
MGQRSLIGIAMLGLAGCPAKTVEQPAPMDMRSRVVADFEAATKANQDAYVALFDFAAVGEMEILLHRYDLNGRLPNLPEDQKAQFAAEDGTPYPADRERRNVGNFYPILAQRTVGTGGCTAAAPRTRYGQLLGTYEALPAGTPAGYETLRTHANEWLAKGGVVGMTCTGGQGGLALVYTAKDNARGYDLITIYDD